MAYEIDREGTEKFYSLMTGRDLYKDDEQEKVPVPPEYVEPSLTKKYDLFGDTSDKKIVDAPQTVTEFREDPENIARFERVMEYLNSRNPDLFDAIDIGNYEDTPDMVESLRDDNARIGTLIKKAMAFKDAPDDIKADYTALRKNFERSELTGVGEWLDAIGDYGTDIVASPEGAALLGSLIFSMGTAAPATTGTYVAAQVAARQGLAQALKRIVSTPVGKTALISGAETGMLDVGTQNLEVSLDEKEEIDLTQTALATGLGTVFGGSIAYGLQKATPTLKRVFSRTGSKDQAIPEETIINDFDDEISGEWMGRKEAGTDIEVRPELRDYNPTMIEDMAKRAVNGELDPENLINTEAVQDMAAGLGGGTRTAEEIVDTIITSSNEGTVQAVKNKIKYNLYKYVASFNSTTFGKVSGFLSPYADISPTAKNLQKRFAHEFGKTYDLNSKVLNKDYNETKEVIMGKYFYDFKMAVENLAKNKIEGTLDETINVDLHKALHGIPSKNKEVNRAALEIKSIYKKIGLELNEAGILAEPIEDYLPRVWDRKAILENENKFAQMLIRHGEANTMEEAQDIVRGMLAKKDALTPEGNVSYGPIFTISRKFDNIADEADFAEFINNDVVGTLHTYLNSASKALAKREVFGVSNVDEFRNTWLNRIDQEVFASTGKYLTRKERKNIERIYNVQTGENLFRLGDTTQMVADGYNLTNRIAYLGLATLASLSEVGITFAKAPISASVKGFKTAANMSFNRVFRKGHKEMQDRWGLTADEAWREMQKVGVALEQGSHTLTNRLSGDQISSKWAQDASNKYFKITLLDQWTKFVEAGAFNAGKNLIFDNATKLAGFGDKPLTKSAKRNLDELVELGIDPDDAIKWVQNGAKTTDDFYQQVLQGAGRFSKETVLHPNAASGQKSYWMSHPVGSMFFQLMSYPAAFSNTVLKGFAKQMAKSPIEGTARVAFGGWMMLELSRLGNYIRSRGESEEGTLEESYTAAFQRIGGFGLLADSSYKYMKSLEATGNPSVFVESFSGPILKDLGLAREGRFNELIGSKLPAQSLYMNKEERRKYLKELRKADRKLKKEFKGPSQNYMDAFATGGIVSVPNASSEPDERIDKMTGIPYNEMAGTAFKDVEERSSFAIGGLASMTSKALSKVIREATEDFISKKEADRVAERIYKDIDTYGGNYRTQQSDDFMPDDYISNDMPSFGYDALDPEFNDYIQAVTYSQLREKTNRTVSELQEEFGDDIGGEFFSKSRGYTDDEINMNESAMMLMDEVDPDSAILSVVNSNIGKIKKVYDEYHVRTPEDEVITEADNNIFEYFKNEMKAEVASKGLNPEKLDTLAAIQFNKLKKEKDTSEFMQELQETMSGVTKREDMPDPLDADLREMKIDEALAESEVKVPLYRMTSSHQNLDYDIAFSLPREVGAHFGTSGQSNFIGLKNLDTLLAEEQFSVPGRMGKKVDMKEYSDEFIHQGLQNMKKEKVLGETIPVPELTMVKGYANIKNPFVIEHDMGSWNARDFMLTQLEVVLQDLEANGVKLTDDQDAMLGELVDRAFDLNHRLDEEFSTLTNERMKFKFKEYKLNSDFRKWLQSLGFDSIKYRNNVESSLYGEDSYSYILFDPRQFKVSTARRFDWNDPRSGYEEGGPVGVEERLANFFGIKPKDVKWAKKLGTKYGVEEEMDGKGDAARHLALGWLASRTNNPTLARAAIDAREYFTLEFNTKGREMDFANNAKGASIQAKTLEEAERAIDKIINNKEATYYTQKQSREMRGYATGGRVIQSGETLSQIAKEAGTTVEELQTLNNIENPDMIYAGRSLVMPADIARKEIATAPQKQPQQAPQEQPSEASWMTRNVPLNVRQFLADLAGNEDTVTEKNLSPEELQALKAAADRAQARGSSSIEYKDYATGDNQYSDVGGGASSSEVFQKTKDDASYSVKTTIGQAKIEIDDEGNVTVRDRYNFNNATDKFEFMGFIKDAYKQGLSLYGQARNIGKWFGSKPGEGSEVIIHLGKLDSDKKQKLVSTIRGTANYVIKEGDSLSTIAEEFGTSVDVLMSKNKIQDPNKIFIGDSLRIT